MSAMNRSRLGLCWVDPLEKSLSGLRLLIQMFREENFTFFFFQDCYHRVPRWLVWSAFEGGEKASLIVTSKLY